jgi:membrane associated rhomboid family serine protease
MLPIRDSIPSRNPPIVLYAIIIGNVLVYLFELSLPEGQLDRLFLLFGIVPARFTHPDLAREAGFPPAGIVPFFTHMFLHGGWLHLIGNLWTLWIFGDNVEDRMGPVRFAVFYLLCGLAAGAVHLATNINSAMPTIGASGAIAGVLGAYFLLFPRAWVVVLVPIVIYPLFVEIPAVVFLVLWFVMQVFSGFGSLGAAADEGLVAWFAHLGGFIAGMLLCRLFVKTPDARHPWQDDEYGPEAAWRHEPRPLRW